MKNFQYIFAILIAFMPLSAFADYTVTGVVNDEQGLPLPDAGVEVVMGGDTLMTNNRDFTPQIHSYLWGPRARE